MDSIAAIEAHKLVFNVLNQTCVNCRCCAVSQDGLIWGNRTVALKILQRFLFAKLHGTHPGCDNMISTMRQYC